MPGCHFTYPRVSDCSPGPGLVLGGIPGGELSSPD